MRPLFAIYLKTSKVKLMLWHVSVISDIFCCYFRDAATQNMIQQIKQLETKLKSTNAHYILEKEEWQRALENVENSWRSKLLLVGWFYTCFKMKKSCVYFLSFFHAAKYEAIEAENKENQGIDLQKELDKLKLQCIKLQVDLLISLLLHGDNISQLSWTFNI